MANAVRKTSVTEMAGIGLLQGISLYALTTPAGKDQLGGMSAVLWMTCWTAVVLVPLLCYFTEKLLGLSRLRRVAIVAGLGFVIPVMLTTEYTILRQREFVQSSFAPLMAAAVLSFIGVPLLAHLRHSPRVARRSHPAYDTHAAQAAHRPEVRAQGWHWPYADLFQTTWRNAIAFVVALVLGGVGLAGLALGAVACRLVGLGVVGQVLFEPPVLVSAYATLYGAAMGLVLKQQTWLIAVRRFLMSGKNLLPLSLAVLVGCELWRHRTDMPVLPAGYTTAVVLAGLIVFLVARANTHYLDGLEVQAPSPRVRKFLVVVWVAAVLALGMVALPLGRLVLQHGWSADRVWATWLWALAAGYVLGYGLSMSRRAQGWMWSIAPTNIAMGGIVCMGMFLLATPFADARSIAAQDQIQRLMAGDAPAESFDYIRLATENDRYGRDALKYLSQIDPKHPHAAHIIAGAKTALDKTTTVDTPEMGEGSGRR
jgi:hypothetical protein